MYRHIKGRKTFTYPVFAINIHEITLKLVKSSKFDLQNTFHWWPYWHLLVWMPARLSYRPIFDHFVTADYRFQSNWGHQKISISFELHPRFSSTENQRKSANSANQHTPANSLLVQPAEAAFPGASQQLPSAASSSLPGASQQSPSLPARMELYTYIWIM